MNRRSFLRAAFGVGVAGPVALKASNYVIQCSGDRLYEGMQLQIFTSVPDDYGSTVVIKSIDYGSKTVTFEKYDPGILHDAKGVRGV